MTTNEKIELLAGALALAEEAAQAVKDTPDSGTCNFDTPYFRPGALRSATIEAAADLAGVDVHIHDLWGSRAAFVEVATRGQAYLRTRMAEAGYQALKAALEPFGFAVSVYYAMD